MKSKQISYTTEKLNRNFSKPTFESTAKVVWQRIANSIAVDILRFYYGKCAKYVSKFNESPTVRLFLTNGNKYNKREKLEQFCRDFNRNRQAQRIANHFGNPQPYNENETQFFINQLRNGKL
jgi:hypothetical protein